MGHDYYTMWLKPTSYSLCVAYKSRKSSVGQDDQERRAVDRAFTISTVG